MWKKWISNFTAVLDLKSSLISELYLNTSYQVGKEKIWLVQEYQNRTKYAKGLPTDENHPSDSTICHQFDLAAQILLLWFRYGLNNYPEWSNHWLSSVIKILLNVSTVSYVTSLHARYLAPNKAVHWGKWNKSLGNLLCFSIRINSLMIAMKMKSRN